ncbi:UNVERIFIED_CONTAM: LysR family transcriptional regulator [Spiribacter pallidus]|jgi:DNA-binding transcriptional LysR family regulator
MKLSWMEDFLALVDHGTFSAAATSRHVTQPAFSRRIRMLEDWLEAELVDRSGNRYVPTAVALEFEPEFRALANRMRDLRTRLRRERMQTPTLTVSAPHTLMATQLPNMLAKFEEWQPGTRFQAITGDIDDCFRHLACAEADLVFGYESEGIANCEALLLAQMDRCELGSEHLLPVMAPASPRGRRLGEGRPPSRVLLYAETSYFGRLVNQLCLHALNRIHGHLEVACESSFAVGLKSLCLAGLGVAWLPTSLVQRELAQGKLICLSDQLPSPSLTITAYRQVDHVNAALPDLWARLTHNTNQLVSFPAPPKGHHP